MKILSYSLIVLSLAALFTAGIMTMTMTIQTAEAKAHNTKIYCSPSGVCYPEKKTCESFHGKGECEKRQIT
jgi:hypothetical protein